MKSSTVQLTAPTLFDIHLIQDNPWQMRRQYTQIADLAENIRSTGRLQQIPSGRLIGDSGEVQLAFGHRRLRAYRYLFEKYGEEWRFMPVEILARTDDEMIQAVWDENGQRQDVTPIEKAWAFVDTMDRLGISQQELADRVKLHKSTVSNLMRLLELPAEVQDLILKGQLLEKNARTLLPLVQVLKNPVRAVEVAKKAAKEGWSVSTIKEAVDKIIEKETVRIDSGIGDHHFDNPPDGCMSLCEKCPFRNAYNKESRCSRPKLYAQKYRMRLVEGGIQPPTQPDLRKLAATREGVRGWLAQAAPTGEEIPALEGLLDTNSRPGQILQEELYRSFPDIEPGQLLTVIDDLLREMRREAMEPAAAGHLTLDTDSHFRSVNLCPHCGGEVAILNGAKMICLNEQCNASWVSYQDLEDAIRAQLAGPKKDYRGNMALFLATSPALEAAVPETNTPITTTLIEADPESPRYEAAGPKATPEELLFALTEVKFQLRDALEKLREKSLE